MNEEPDDRWERYYKAQEGRAPRQIFTDALSLFDQSETNTDARFAVDLGCGDGTETLHLLRNRWHVLAIDQEPGAIARIQSLVPSELQPHLETRVAPFENLTLPTADFVYAGFSLPFCHPTKFISVWAEIVAALCPGGRFAGQLFGIHDTWTINLNMSFHTRAQTKGLFNTFHIEYFQEIDEDGDSFSGPKHWHIFHVIARKK